MNSEAKLKMFKGDVVCCYVQPGSIAHVSEIFKIDHDTMLNAPLEHANGLNIEEVDRLKEQVDMFQEAIDEFYSEYAPEKLDDEDNLGLPSDMYIIRLYRYCNHVVQESKERLGTLAISIVNASLEHMEPDLSTCSQYFKTMARSKFAEELMFEIGKIFPNLKEAALKPVENEDLN